VWVMGMGNGSGCGCVGVSGGRGDDVGEASKEGGPGFRPPRPLLPLIPFDCPFLFSPSQGELYIIDVSQAVDLDHPKALDFLREDCKHVNDYFR
jgi:hypothetical protein